MHGHNRRGNVYTYSLHYVDTLSGEIGKKEELRHRGNREASIFTTFSLSSS
jgi:hypothetical protein